MDNIYRQGVNSLSIVGKCMEPTNPLFLLYVPGFLKMADYFVSGGPNLSH